MKTYYQIVIIALTALLAFGCTSKEAPVDSQGKTPQQVMMETYTLILEGNYSEAKKNFNPEFIDAVITKNNSTFEEYCKNTEGWKISWLKTKVKGNDYNDNLWRVKIIPDEGKGANNGPGVVQDLYIIEGKWKIVFWNHYPKS